MNTVSTWWGKHVRITPRRKANGTYLTERQGEDNVLLIPDAKFDIRNPVRRGDRDDGQKLKKWVIRYYCSPTSQIKHDCTL